MFSKIPSFFSMPNASASSDNATPTFAGMPLVNPLLNDAQQNIESLDERIQQLESVAQWLNMNLQLVNSTVQQLQVQKQTLQALAQWQALSKDALGEFAKMNPFAAAQGVTEEVVAEAPAVVKAKPEPKKAAEKHTHVEAPESSEVEPDSESSTEALPAAFEKMAQSWWDGLQHQFAQLAQPLVDAAKTTVAEAAEHGLNSTTAAPTRTSRAKKAPAAVSKTPRKTTSSKVVRTKS
ncbi:hypothetical protein DTO96_100694 [Ephemeroptericola cinctiostellae]|uniref:Uncharacterized protein n=1 Tax=Ephemeroptericola cinctiostellae TaxID=2268024 RepID=A0A345D9D9_9BURK|nr:PhaM family polyhydroxyalkanoate granule multifunctional regulatory protein [Ephemeroptericola cinctiostellae]AXF84977.1 hypothetical protein DTO96_100694 [Ephemeroptericola cinctiostellae]